MTVRDHNEPFGEGFQRGVQFRTYYEFSIASGQSVYIKHTAPVEFYVLNQRLTVDAGSIRLSLYNGASDATAFTNNLTISGMNRSVERGSGPYYVVQSTITTGGTISGGTVVDVARVVTATSTAAQVTIGGATNLPRALPAGSYHQRLENFGVGTATGVYYIDWEEILP